MGSWKASEAGPCSRLVVGLLLIFAKSFATFEGRRIVQEYRRLVVGSRVVGTGEVQVACTASEDTCREHFALACFAGRILDSGSLGKHPVSKLEIYQNHYSQEKGRL